MKYHIKSNGEPGVCKAEVNCPLDQSLDSHFESPASARATFEKVMESSDKDIPEKASEFLKENKDTILETLGVISDSGNEIEINGRVLEDMSDTRFQEVVSGNSKEIADLIASYTEGEDDYEDGLFEMTTISHAPMGSELSGEHFANVFERDGQQYVLDSAYAEINPNAPHPYISTVEEWRNSINRVSFIGVEEKIPDPIDPRTLTLPKVKPGEYNPLIEKSRMSEAIKEGVYSVRFLIVDDVKVASIKYRLEDDGVPTLCSIETRHEYKNQGYMKKLIKDLSKEYGVERPRSSGSMTPNGYNFTKHLTDPPANGESKINFPEYTDNNPFTFVSDWVEGKFL